MSWLFHNNNNNVNVNFSAADRQALESGKAHAYVSVITDGEQGLHGGYRANVDYGSSPNCDFSSLGHYSSSHSDSTASVIGSIIGSLFG